MREIRTGVIGIGNMGSAHAACIAAGEIRGLALAAVCEIDKNKARDFAERHRGIRIYHDYKEMIADGTVDAVVIAVPHPLHAEIAGKALEARLHVLLEKPVDISVSRAEKLNRIARESDSVFAIMFNQRTNPLFRKARDIVQGGELGGLKRTIWIATNWYRTQYYYDSGDWRATWAGEGGGVLLNQCPHQLDLWQWICGMPESVTAFCDIAKYHRIEVEDDVTLVTRYKNGAVGTFIATTGEFPGTNRLEVSGDKGKIVLENGMLKWWKLKEPEPIVREKSRHGFTEIEYEYFEIKQEALEPAHKGILRNFSDAILTGAPLLAPGTDGIWELMISNAAYLSGFQGSIPVPLPFHTEEFDRLLRERAARSSYKRGGVPEKMSEKYNGRWRVNW